MLFDLQRFTTYTIANGAVVSAGGANISDEAVDYFTGTGANSADYQLQIVQNTIPKFMNVIDVSASSNSGNNLVQIRDKVQSYVSNLQHKLYRIVNSFSYTVNSANSCKLLADNVTVSLTQDSSGTYTKHSLTAAMNGVTQSSTLTTNTSTTNYYRSIVRLVENGGFLLIEPQHATKGYEVGASIRPFIITAAGKPSLGTTVSLASSQTEAYSSRSIAMHRSIFNTNNIMFFLECGDAAGTVYKYTDFDFAGHKNAATRVKALTTLGTNYSNVPSGAYTDTVALSPLRYTSMSSVGNTINLQRARAHFLPMIMYYQAKYDANHNQISKNYYCLVNHGLYREDPLVFEIDTVLYTYGIQGVWRSKRIPARCYILGLKTTNTTFTYSTSWYNNIWDVYILNFQAQKLIKTSWKLGDIIDDMWL